MLYKEKPIDIDVLYKDITAKKPITREHLKDIAFGFQNIDVAYWADIFNNSAISDSLKAKLLKLPNLRRKFSRIFNDVITEVWVEQKFVEWHEAQGARFSATIGNYAGNVYG